MSVSTSSSVSDMTLASLAVSSSSLDDSDPGYHSASSDSIIKKTQGSAIKSSDSVDVNAAESIISPPVSPVANATDNASQDEDKSDITQHSGTHMQNSLSISSSDAQPQQLDHSHHIQQQQSLYHTQTHSSDIVEHESHHGSDSDPMLYQQQQEHEQDQEDGSVPTLEQMGLGNLSEMDLRLLLQNAYEVIQEKERNLSMAAMVGQDLVETNTNLQAKYQHALTQLRHQRMHRPRQLTPPRKIILSSAPDAVGNIAVNRAEDGAHSDNENWVDFDQQPSSSSGLAASGSSLHPSGINTSSTSPHHKTSFRRNSNHHSGMMRSRSHKDIEKLASLEELNAELQAKIDAITKELKQGRRQAFKRHRRAEQELKTVKNELERTTVKVVDLEEQNTRLIEASRMIRLRRIQLQKQLPAPGSIPGSTMANLALEMQGDEIDEMTIQEMLAEDNRIFEELKDRLQSLERKNTALVHQKVEADKRSQQLAQELADMQKDHEDLMANLCGLSELQTAYGEQSAHVRELENTIQELQNQISTMSSRLSQMNSPLMSPSVPSSPIQSLWHRDDADFKALKTILHGSISPQPMVLKSPGLRGQRRPRKTLLAELESEWFRDVSFFGPPRVPDHLAQKSPQQQPIHIGGIHAPKSPKALKNHRHESDSEMFSDDAGGRVKGWRERIQDMGEESACESSSCIRKRHHRFKYTGSDTEGTHGELDIGHDGDDSDVDLYHLHQRQPRPKRLNSGHALSEDDDDLSDCSDPHHLNYHRPSTPGCCCYMYDDYSGYTSYDEDGEESVVGWAHFEDYDASTYGYDIKRDGYYVGRRSRRGIFGIFGLVHSVILFFRLMWRWCRFLCILSTALGIAIYRGPDALLTDGR
ncbi:hypothetical protein BX616_000749 [Lobosporangium transversale]|uniref:Uncharacterized protein n=1 Tax=Lobosporangium transversale TaxID=64571 RepID=A0A1Y2GHQ9_9FUNG|nr:hypothetical protein BCR41DRAFT_357008 [Lobosporangium transversale]KAF9906363.1 hypothetical protein BX616_000749 [Lobosporangium transversale]ORZ11310.1 hypothetical protein BCR41DRAFT_357008 [Lobosporangium transversale]|eukprot:XP_021879625.1 hypothetical protein BCR41DRAFT_357008 [Lobosporangium transversale]